MEVDPAASMRVWAVEVDLGGRTFEIPAMPAADWYPLLVRGDVTDILGVIQGHDFDEMILTGEITVKELTEVLSQAVEEISGRSLNAALVLVQVAKMIWPVVGGELARRGFRWDQAPLGAALDAIYVVVMERLKPEPARQFEALLNTETAPGTGRRGKLNRDRAMSEFEKMAGPKPPTAPSTAARSSDARPRTRPRPPRRRPAGR